LVEEALDAEDEEAYGRFAADDVGPTDCRAGFDADRVSRRKFGVD
jgi:hypothetical protein